MAKSSNLLLGAAILLTSGYATASWAQDEETSAPVDEGDHKVMYKKKTEIDFEGLDVSGELVKPSGMLLLDRKRAAFNPLIKLRQDFNEEMSESVDEIK